jgi:hypothetical protein
MSNPFDVFSLPALYIFTVILLLLGFELGYRLGKIWKKRSPTTTEGAVGSVAGITLGLLAFLLAFIVSLALSRFDTRKELVMDDATSIRTAVLRAELLGEPTQSEVRTLLTEYVDVRLNATQTGNIPAAAQRSNELLDQVWAIAAEAGANGGSESASLFIQSVNDTMTVNTERVFVTTQTRLPFTILVAIYIISFLSLVLEGAQSQFQGNRNLVSMVVLVVVLSVVLLLIFDLDRPQEGFLQVSQQPMLDLQAELHAAQ